MERSPKEPAQRDAGQVGDDEWEPSAPAMAPDGGIAPGWAARTESRPLQPLAETLCAKGPCRHFWAFTVPFLHGNAPGTLAKEPVQTHAFCLASPASDTSLADTEVLECSRWDPMQASEVAALEARREDYYARNPGDRPAAEVAAEGDDEEG